MKKDKVDAGFEQLESIASGFRASQVLFTAVRLRLFDALKNGQKNAEQLAKIVGADSRGITILCNALAGLDLIKKHGNSYGLSLLARKYLLTDSPYSQQAIWLHNAALYEKWGKLFDVVKTGKPIQWDEVSKDLQADEQSFARAMASTASFLARETAEAIDLRNTKTMLDIGGGPGIYAIEFAKRQPELKVTVMDNAPTLEVARENIKKAGLLDRIELKPGNALTDDLGASYDLILMSNVIHQYSNEENTKLIKRAARALNSGGKLLIKDFILNPCRTKPIKASLFAINMLVNTEKGNCYTVDDIKAWFKSAALKPSRVIIFQSPTKIVIGRKK